MFDRAALAEYLRGKMPAVSFGLMGLVGIGMAAAAFAAASAPAKAPPMALPGSFHVTATGAGSYSIPITVPPGTAGMVPAISLNYSSQNHDGYVGWGWSLSYGAAATNLSGSAVRGTGRTPTSADQLMSVVTDNSGIQTASTTFGSGDLSAGNDTGGLRAISRCPRTLAQDGVHGSVNYDANDRFCLDGQRLAVVSGTYGASGSKYRTEIESFQDITLNGSGTGSTSYFVVRTKNGQTLEFGNTSVSRVYATGTSVPRAWALDKVTDTKGNYLTISYDYDNLNGEAYPLEIDYTGNTGTSLAPYNKVVFIYSTTRADAVPYYQAGSHQLLTHLLTDVKTYQGASLVLDYKLAYRAGTTTTHSRLTSVTLCDSSTTNCLPATTFTWQGGTGTVSFHSVTLSLGANATGILADVNGDGIPDTFVSNFVSGCATEWALFTGNPTGGFTAGPSNYFCAPFGSVQPVDLNGDGLADFMFTVSFGTPSNSFAMNTGSGLSMTGTSISGLYYQGDYNADGRTDFYSDGGDSGTGSPVLWLSNGDGTFSSGTPAPIGDKWIDVADFDGDGCADVLFGVRIPPPPIVPANIDFSCSPATSSITVSDSLNNIADGRTGGVIGDFNGDGKADLFIQNVLNLSSGTGMVPTTFDITTITSMYTTYQIYGGDFNGDGRTDIAVWSNTGSTDTVTIYLSTGTGFVNAGTTTIGTGVGISVADLNGDGASDLMILGGASFTPVAEFINDYTPEVITAVSNGIGATTNIAYDRLNDATVYTKGTGATYPTQDVENGMYVVSEVDTANGLGVCTPPSMTNCYRMTYAYAGAKADLQGRGFLGFSQVVATDPQTGLIQTTNYRTDFPFIGVVDSQTMATSVTRNGCVAGTTLKHVANSYSATPPTSSPAPYFVFQTRADATGADCDGTNLPPSRTNYTYDAYGNVTQSAETTYVSTIGGTVSSTSTTNNTFSNNTTNWLFLLTQEAVINVVGSSNITRTTAFAYATGTDYLNQVVVEPGSSTLLQQTTYTLDGFGNRTVAQVSGSNFTTRTSHASYDTQGRFILTATDALGHVQHYTSDPAFGGLLTHTDLNGLVTSWTYDTFGRKTLEVRPDGTKTAGAYFYCSGVAGGSYSCPTNGAFVTQATPQNTATGLQNGPRAVVYFDYLNRPIATDVQGFDGCVIRSSTIFDANGRVYQTSRPYFVATAGICSAGTPKWTTNTYDDLGRITLAVMPDASHTTYAYHGLVSSVTNNLSQTTTTTKNPQGLAATIADALTHNTSYVYDAFNNLLSVTDPSGNATRNTYDIRGDKTASNDPDMGSWSYTYDGLGELLTQTDAKSQVTTLTYDLLGRVTQRAETGLTSTWTWDTATHGVGLLASAATSGGYSRVMTYDTISRPATTTLTIGSSNYTYTTTYDTTTGKIATVTYPSTFATLSVYNALGYPSQIKDSSTGSALWTANTLDAELHLLQQTQGNGVVTNQTFDANTGLPQTLRAGTSGAVASFDYGFDTIGNLVSRADNNESYTERFCYDQLNRLTSYQLTTSTSCPLSGSGAKSVSYDALGNITNKSDVGAYTYPTSGPSSVRPHAVSSIAGTVNGVVNPNYHYDANGNMDCVYTGSYPTGCSGGGAVRKIVSTSFNMADTITQGTTTVAFTYDSEHQRITQASTVGGVTATTSYLNDPASGAMSEHVSSGGSVTWHDYVQVGGQIVLQHSTSSAPATWAYFTLDSLGSVAVIADASGAVTQRLSYDAWGKPRNPDGSDAACGAIASPTTRGYTNQEQIASLCLVNLNARMYDPTIGRFLSPDSEIDKPYEPQALNRFTYVDNRPLTLVDPTGMHGCASDPSCTPTFYSTSDSALKDFDFDNGFTFTGGGTSSGSVGSLASGGSEGGQGLSSGSGQNTQGSEKSGSSSSTHGSPDTNSGRYIQVAGGATGHWDGHGASGHWKPAEEPPLENGGEDIIFGALTLPLGGEGFELSGAESAFEGQLLKKSLASESQMGEIVSGAGQPFAGAGANQAIHDVPRLVSEYGGKAGDWQKVRSSSYTASDGSRFETHAYRNMNTGQVVELKTKVAGH